MKKPLIIILAIISGIIVLVAIAGIYKFNFTNDNIYLQTGGKLNSKDATYIIDGESITLKDGVNELVVDEGSESKTITRYFGNDASGDLNGDRKNDTAFILTQDGGGSGTFYYITAALATDKGFNGLNAILLGDRISPQTTEIKDGKIIVNYADRKVGEPMSATSSVGFSRYFQVTNNQLIEVNAPVQAVQIANPASVNCSKQGGNLVIQKRGDGGEYGLCYFDDNRACEEWAMMRGDCPVGGVKTTGFDTIDQKYCAWSGGKTLAVPQSVCTLKDGSKCSTEEFYDGKCPAAK